MNLRGKRVLITVPEMKKTSIELSSKDEELIMQEAMKKWQKLEVYAVGDEVSNISVRDQVYIQTYAIESGEKIEIEGRMRILVPENAIAIVW